MKKMRFLPWLFILMAVVLAACGGRKTAPRVERPAGDLNLARKDLGSGWKMIREVGGFRDTNTEAFAERFLDINMRLFQNSSLPGMVLSIVVTGKSDTEARKEFRSLDEQDILTDLHESLKEVSLEEVEAPVLAEQQRMMYGRQGKVHIYTLALRQNNMVATLVFLGPDGEQSRAEITRLARLVVQRAQESVSQ